jgi:hypothetical protein
MSETLQEVRCRTSEVAWPRDSESSPMAGTPGARRNRMPAHPRSKIMGSLVWNIKNGMSGAISKDVAEEARYQQDIRIAETDLMIILKQIIAFCDCYEGTVPGNVKQTRIIEHYQTGYKENRGADNKVINRTYLVSLTALSHFTTEYVNYRKRKDIPIDLQSIKTDILKLMVDIDVPADPNGDEIEDINDYKGNKDDIIYNQHHFKWKPLDKVNWVPTLKCAIRGYYLVVDAPHIAKIEALAMNYLLDLQDFIGQNFKNFI